MKHLLLVLGAAALAVSGPAAAKGGRAHGHHKAERHAKRSKHHASRYYGYRHNACPPGLAWKNELCIPPGHYKKLYRIGQRYPRSYGSMWSYNQIPYDLRDRYDFDPGYRYYYGDGYLYRVDPKTLLIREVVNAIIR